MDNDIERESNAACTSATETTGRAFEPVRTAADEPSRPLSRGSTAGSRSIVWIRSQNGYGVEDELDEKYDTGIDRELGDVPEKDPFEVGWDGGENDPMCPRSFNKARKWMITFIVSGGSFCV